ncbi:MAG: hypothetical protein ABR508_10980, partial [Candidatus Baltobacteraceae bacterium]
TMKAEEAPAGDLEELREIARRSDIMILPPARFVLMGAASGELLQPVFTPREEPTPTPEIAKAAQRTQAASPPAAAAPLPQTATPAAQPAALPAFEFPAPPPFPAPPASPFAMPAAPETPAPPPSFGLPWQWEPPETGEEPKP